MAEVYELDKPLTSAYRDVEYYTSLLGGSRTRLLEVACGTGRFLVPLLEAGADAHGLDHSPEMLEVCRDHCTRRGYDPPLYVADMADFELPHMYDVVLIASGAIKELDGRDAALQALSCCGRILKPGGRLYVDLVPPRHVSGSVSPDRPAEPGRVRAWQRGGEEWILQTLHLAYDSAANRTTKLVRYEKYRDHDLVKAELHTFVIQHWTLWEFHMLLSEAGFVDVVVTADYEAGSPPGMANDDWTFCATSP